MKKITVNHTPVSASRPRVTQYGTFYLKKYNDYRKLLKKEFSSINFDCDKEKKYLKLTIKFYIPIPKSYTKKRREEIKEIKYLHNIKPDLDNLLKAILDGMNENYYKDDAEICILNSEKYYTEDLIGRTEIVIEEI